MFYLYPDEQIVSFSLCLFRWFKPRAYSQRAFKSQSICVSFMIVLSFRPIIIVALVVFIFQRGSSRPSFSRLRNTDTDWHLALKITHLWKHGQFKSMLIFSRSPLNICLYNIVIELSVMKFLWNVFSELIVKKKEFEKKNCFDLQTKKSWKKIDQKCEVQ